MFLGRRGSPWKVPLQASSRRRSSLNKCVVQPCFICTHKEMKSGHDTGSRLRQPCTAEKKKENLLLGVVCLLTNGVLIRVRCWNLPTIDHLPPPEDRMEETAAP